MAETPSLASTDLFTYCSVVPEQCHRLTVVPGRYQRPSRARRAAAVGQRVLKMPVWFGQISLKGGWIGILCEYLESQDVSRFLFELLIGCIFSVAVFVAASNYR